MKKLLFTAFIALIGFAASAQNPCPYKYGANEEDSLKALEQITLFKTYFNQKQYSEAYTPWQYIVKNCPCGWNGTFSNATSMLENLIKNEQNAERKALLIDTLIWTQTAYSTYHPSKCTYGKGLSWQAYYSMKYRGKDSTVEAQAFNDFVTAVELEKAEIQPAVWDMYFQLAVRQTQRTHDTTYVVEAYERATEYIDEAIVNQQAEYEAAIPKFEELQKKFEENSIGKMAYDKEISKLTKDTTACVKTILNYRKMNAKLEKGFAPYAKGSVLLAIYEKKFEENKDNLPVLKKMISLMSTDSVCRASQIYNDILVILYNDAPSGKIAYFLGMLEFQKKNTDKAISYFNQAINLYTTNEEKAQPYYFIATIEFSRNSYSAARGHALDAVRCNPKFGRPYILIGDMYRNSYNQFTNGGNGVIAGAVYWVAADKYNRAKAVDPSLTNECNRKLGSLHKVDGKTLVENNLTPGQSYHVGGWINENTTVR